MWNHLTAHFDPDGTPCQKCYNACPSSYQPQPAIDHQLQFTDYLFTHFILKAEGSGTMSNLVDG